MTAAVARPQRPGRLDDDDVVCGHGDELLLPTDPSRGLIGSCERGAVFSVPSQETRGTVAVCGWHLARYLEAFPVIGRRLVAEHEAGRVVADPAITGLEDRQAPKRYEALGRTWRRLALDQSGRVHYLASDDGEPAALELEADLETVHATVLDDGGLQGYLGDVRDRRGWAEADVGALHHVAGGAPGGEDTWNE